MKLLTFALPAEHFSVSGSGIPLKLHFKLPPRAADNGAEPVINKGIFGMDHVPEGSFAFEVRKGVRLAESKVISKHRGKQYFPVLPKDTTDSVKEQRQ